DSTNFPLGQVGEVVCHNLEVRDDGAGVELVESAVQVEQNVDVAERNNLRYLRPGRGLEREHLAGGRTTVEMDRAHEVDAGEDVIVLGHADHDQVGAGAGIEAELSPDG